MHLKAFVSPCSLTCIAFVLSRYADGIPSAVGPQWRRKATSGQDSPSASPPNDSEPEAVMTKGEQHQPDLRVDAHKPLSKGQLPYTILWTVLGRKGWQEVLGEGSMGDLDVSLVRERKHQGSQESATTGD